MDKVFLEIFNTALTGGWIVLIVLLLRLALKKAPRAYSCALWGIVGLRLIWPFSIESAVSLIPSPEVIPQSQLYDKTPQVQTGIPSLNTAINPFFTETFQTAGTTSFNPLQWAMWIAGWVWVIGMVSMAVYSLISYLRLRRQVRTAVRQEGNVYLCDDVASPFILGIFRPKIYLPSDMPQEQMECVLAHEQAHLKRKDHWVKPLGFLLLTVYWFHPLLWVAYILLCRDIEFACDEKVIANMDGAEKAHYSETLLACSISHKHIAACPLAFGETGVKRRIQSVLKYKKPAVWVTVVTVILCIALAACSLTERLNPTEQLNSIEDPNGVFTKSYGIARDLYSTLMIHATYFSNQPEYLFGSDGKIYTMTRDDDGKYVADCIVESVEKIVLTEENFDSLVSDENWLARGIDAVSVRENNVETWSGSGKMGTHYVMLQKNGDVLLCRVGRRISLIQLLEYVGSPEAFYEYVDWLNARIGL